MKKIGIILATAVFFFSSCKKNLPDVGSTATEKFANEWWVTVNHGTRFVKIATYNTSLSTNEIWVDDLVHVYGFKIKAAVNSSDMTFSAVSSSNEYYDPTDPASFPLKATITEGKILAGAGHSKTGNVTDSIHFKAEFSDDPGTIYEINGHARTRFEEDEY